MVGGNGADLVVLEAGLGISGLYWGPVHELLAAHTRVVAYERAGYGKSDPDDHPRTLARLAADLDVVIDAFPHRRLVLVGHSWGGPIVRVVGARRLKRGQPVTGLVLVDPSDENSGLYFSSAARRQFSAQASLMVPLARLRVLGPLFRRTMAGLQDPLLSAVVSASCSRPAARATSAEICHVVDGLEGLRDAPAVLGGLPIRVISGQRSGVLDRKVRASIIQAHKETVAQNAGASFVPADRSAHMVPISEPGLVASEALTIFTE
jgi:pimeloyl-ACP methyl ester carboxylesterase